MINFYDIINCRKSNTLKAINCHKDHKMKKIDLFIENARLLEENFGIVPLLYGSLGLGFITEKDIEVDDIDVLIPRVFLNAEWQSFKAVLEDNGYVLTDEHEHTFCYNGVAYSYAEIEELEAFAGIGVSQIGVCEYNGCSFLILSAEQYLRVYQRSSEDGYRINVRKKKDAEKIEYIKRFISESEH